MNFTIFSLNVEIVSSKITKRVIKVMLLQLTENSIAEVFQGPKSSVCNDISVSAILSHSSASVIIMNEVNPFFVWILKFCSTQKYHTLYFYHYIYCRLLSWYHSVQARQSVLQLAHIRTRTAVNTS